MSFQTSWYGLRWSMLGARKSLLTKLTSKQPSLIAFHYNCHVTALIANHACYALPGYLEDLTINIWYSKQQRIFEEYQAFVDCTAHKLLRAALTKWLCLEACVQHLLDQHNALLPHFQSSEETLASGQRITSVLENPLSSCT